MNRNVCDWVMMQIPMQEDGNSLPLSSDVLQHIESCQNCRALVQTKTALRRLMNSVRMDPLSERRLLVQVMSRRRVSQPQGRFIFSRPSIIATAALFLILAGQAVIRRSPNGITRAGTTCQPTVNS
jgi:predicted anti-sigma-YlaC factor YlaD